MIRPILLTAALLVLAALFYIAVILIQPQPAADAGSEEALEPMPAVRVTDPDNLPALIRSFPAPVLAALPTAPLELRTGERTDAAYEGGTARTMTLTYSLTDGRTLTLTSLYPQRADSLMRTDGWHILAAEVPAINGMPGMAVQKEASLRLLYENGDTLYAVEGTDLDLETMFAATAVLQLYH